MQLVDERNDLPLAVVRRDPGPILDGAEAKEPQPPRKPATLQPPLLWDRVPYHRPELRAVRLAPEREDPPIALLEQRDGAGRGAVGDQPADLQAVDDPAADHTPERDARRACREPELAKQRDEPTRPHDPVLRHNVCAEECHDEILRPGLEAVRPHGAHNT